MTAVKVASIFFVVVLGGFVGVSCWTIDEQVSCRIAAHDTAYDCVENAHLSENPTECMYEVLINYFNCTGPITSGQSKLTFSNNGLLMLREYQAIGPNNVRCIVDNLLDLAKCVTDGELTPDQPFHWDWTVLLQCFMGNLPSYVKCIS